MTNFEKEFEKFENAFPGFTLYTNYNYDTLEQKVLISDGSGRFIEDVWDGETPVEEYLIDLVVELKSRTCVSKTVTEWLYDHPNIHSITIRNQNLGDEASKFIRVEIDPIEKWGHKTEFILYKKQLKDELTMHLDDAYLAMCREEKENEN